MVFIHWQRSICKNQNKMVTESSLKQFSIFGNFVWLQKDRDQKMLCFAHVFYSTWTYKWGAAAEALSVSRWLSSEECREEKDWRDLQDSLLDLPPVVKGEPPGVFTDTENDLSSSNFDLVSSLAALDRNTSSLPSILSTTSPRLWTWKEKSGKRGYLYSKFLWTTLLSFSATYIYTWLNIANSWPIICFQPVAAVLRRLFSTFFGSRDQIVSKYLLFWHRKINSRG